MQPMGRKGVAHHEEKANALSICELLRLGTAKYAIDSVPMLLDPLNAARQSRIGEIGSCIRGIRLLCRSFNEDNRGMPGQDLGKSSAMRLLWLQKSNEFGWFTSTATEPIAREEPRLRQSAQGSCQGITKAISVA